MKIIRVFPDYMSSGLWNDYGVNLEPHGYFDGILTHEDLMALKYWHAMWEFHTDDYWNTTTLSKSFWDGWTEDGKKLVAAWNAKQDTYQFVYVE